MILSPLGKTSYTTSCQYFDKRIFKINHAIFKLLDINQILNIGLTIHLNLTFLLTEL